MTTLRLANPADLARLATTIADPIDLLLADKRSGATRRAYAGDLADFFRDDASPRAVADFLAQSVPEVAQTLAGYKARLLREGKSEATVNRRLAAVRSLLRFCYRLGLAKTDGRGLVDGEKARAYRDTRGVDVDAMRELLALPTVVYGAKTVHALRDAALLRLLCENALRRAEACALDVGDFEAATRRLMVTGKGKGTQKAPVTLSAKCAGAISAYLTASGQGQDAKGPLFRSLDRRPGYHGRRLTADGLYSVIVEYGRRLGVELAPHKLRHSAITAALDAGGTVREVQKLSRHAKLETVQAYDDSRADHQGKMTRLLSGLL